MRKNKGITVIELLIGIALGVILISIAYGVISRLTACSNSREHTVEKTEVKSQNYLLAAKDFDLQTVVSALKADKVKSAEDLQKFVNDPTTGVNNVDVDKDKKIDFIQVKENRGKDGKIALDFQAIPSGTKDPKEAVTVANIAFNKTQENVEVSGGYPNYVNGYQNHYYHYSRPGLGVGDALFLMWMFQPRPLYVPVFSPAVYVPRARMDYRAIETRRTIYQKQTRVSPITKSSLPSSFKIPRSTRVPSRFKAQTTGTTFKSRAGTTQSFKNRTGMSNPKATGWGRSTSAPKAKSAGWGSSSGSRKSSGWGSSSSKQKSSSWGRSSGSRSNFGGSRRRK